MKSRSGNEVFATVCAALTIIGCCLSSIAFSHKRRTVQHQQLEEAVQNWEGEGGAVVALDLEEDETESEPA